MKKYFWIADSCLCSLTVLALSATAAPGTTPSSKPGNSTNKSTPALASTNLVAVTSPSVFIQPKNPKEGKDPFFPLSSRPYFQKGPAPTNDTSRVDINLTLTGIIPSKKLCMVNGRTFSEGEEGVVRANGVSKNIRCIKINEESAIVELLPEGERRELKLRQNVSKVTGGE